MVNIHIFLHNKRTDLITLDDYTEVLLTSMEKLEIDEKTFYFSGSISRSYEIYNWIVKNTYEMFFEVTEISYGTYAIFYEDGGCNINYILEDNLNDIFPAMGDIVKIIRFE